LQDQFPELGSTRNHKLLHIRTQEKEKTSEFRAFYNIQRLESKPEHNKYLKEQNKSIPDHPQ
jgi:hypothetical protein